MGFEYPVTPLNPLTHPVNEVSVFPVYVIISSSILITPYLSGNPLVPVRICPSFPVDVLTLIVVSL